MKNIILLLIIVFILSSCSAEEGNGQKVYYELVPIKRCIMPYSFVAGQTYEFEMLYKKPTSCHFYKGVYFAKKQGNLRIVAIQCGVVESNSCITYGENNSTNSPDSLTANYTFTATGTEPYVFRFWKGKNAQGEDTYYDVEVPVEN